MFFSQLLGLLCLTLLLLSQVSFGSRIAPPPPHWGRPHDKPKPGPPSSPGQHPSPHP
ncbi:hypothetical protein MKW98_020972 [Papaver atlanticum]|uniref:Uncharacterized protein n=1 Tax=Papaver atlanticum TaxID=357466 RepID=A0AAD4SMT8_9MAGN|nr:hypothetical protein MKW98_020972 [Papaver atlanticum]